MTRAETGAVRYCAVWTGAGRRHRLAETVPLHERDRAPRSMHITACHELLRAEKSEILVDDVDCPACLRGAS